MTDDYDERLARLETQIDTLVERIERMERVLYGNSDGGVVSRLSRIEERIRHMNTLVKLAITLTASTFITVLAELVVH